MLKKIGKYTILAKPVKCKYWKPGTNIVKYLCKKLKNKVKDGDIIVFSEKALATALGAIIDESEIAPSMFSKVIVFLLMRVIWGYMLGILTKLKKETLEWIRKYPVAEGAAHKQLALILGGLLQVLKPSSEAGIDTSNLPYSYASLPLNSCSIVEKLRKTLSKCLEANIAVMIVDSDRTYYNKKYSIALSSRKTCVKGLINLGVLSYISGRMFRAHFKPKATPVSYAGPCMSLELMLEIAEIADKVRGVGAGRTVFEMARRFNTSLNGVTWEMLSSINHYPIVIVRILGKN
ncbi:MAG: hypothetical protein DRO23_10650 [Thermoprotei archaeon]|nr:MAG: hypothetical protein DRO23_10650 [Thermoprotei archaeon]